MCVLTSRRGRLDAGDLDFEAAVLRVIVLADAVGNIDDAALFQIEGGRAGGKIPANGANGRAGAGKDGRLRPALCCLLGRCLLRQFKANMALFHDARGGEQASIPGDKNGLGVAVAERLELAQPAGQHRRDAIERQFSMNAQQPLRRAAGQVRVSVNIEAALEFRQCAGGQRKADGEGVATKSREEIGAAFNGVEQLKSIDGAA